MVHYITTNGIGNAWVANEVRRVEAAGIPVRVTALRRDSKSYFESDWAAAIDRRSTYLYPIGVLSMACSVVFAAIRFGPRFWNCMLNAMTGPRESARVRFKSVLHLFVACRWAMMLRGQHVDRIHSQWIHSCGTVGMYAARLLDVPFTFTGHATDLFRDRCALEDKIRAADKIVCISEFHRRFFLEQGASPEQLVVVYCGIDTSHFKPSQLRGPDGVFRIRSSGRLVEKKGFADLIDACGVLRDRGLQLRCTIGGSGPLEADLRRRVAERGLEGIVEITGQPLKQERIPEFMNGGDAYCLPCVWAADGDVDGLPQMLMEAMACGLPAVSTRLVGIPDLVVDGSTGLLVEPGDVEALADALERLACDRGMARRLAEAGRERVARMFDLDRCLEPLFAMFRGTDASPRRPISPTGTALTAGAVGAAS